MEPQYWVLEKLKTGFAIRLEASEWERLRGMTGVGARMEDGHEARK